ncbi:MAG: T9SS type A sorting domain-containing protein [Bacteroidetes bacterium]|nr:T9SS type A sorting domain-containing protein [Bacteroidota bacterium]MBU1115595.1 T9SS type A sorting domain-containing protein [Bacteroidota bacterium]
MKFLIITFMLISSFVLGQNEVLVNTQTDTTQRDSHIARDAAGNYIIAWDSENQATPNSQSDIYFQLFDSNNNKVGSETLVNTATDNEQERPALSMNGNGNFVVVWASHTGNFDSIFDIKGRLYKSNQPVGDEFLINTTTQNSQTKPAVSMNSDGSFVVTWESWFQIDSKDIYLQQFDSDGNKIGNETLVNTTTNSGQGRPTIKHFNNGSFIVIWESWETLNDGTSNPGYDLYGKIFAADGSLLKDDFLINTYTENFQWFADVETFDDMSFIIAWCSWDQDGHWGGVYLQKFGSLGEKIGTEVLVNSTTVNYQWLPKIRKTSENNFAVVWSSWQQDGSREGVYLQVFDENLNKLSFETKVNDYSDNYQWEPDFISTDNNELLVTWSSWGKYDDYDIILKKVTPIFPQGVIQSKTVMHTEGNSTSRFYVHVIDSTKLTGNNYEISFNIVDEFNSNASIKNLTTQTTIIDNYPIDKGEGVFYLTKEFEGVAVELNPTFKFALDIERSYIVNNSGHNINFSIGSGSGTKKLAPIDVVIVWGNTDTLSNGNYANPLDSAYNTTGKKVVKCPFYAWNLTDSEKMDLVIIEPSANANLRWNPKEEVGILTPSKYATSFPQYHASMRSEFSGSSVILPSVGDSNFIFTQRPISSDDKFTFQTLKSYITTDSENLTQLPTKFELMQNYPNPFNPTTTIVYSIPKSGNVKVKVINILGETVSVLVNDYRKEGIHKLTFNASNIVSGVYFYTIQYGNKFLSKKMLLIK